ncbi:hypothetical protein PGUG_02342 [Meyerozyma guilliermondii ATCC 6260]|uniref:FAD-binding PCMH-type domain-containing protein n=1 Tax=Meyerozyma guilliermondii (strain ATCC 6260 / CBS 566 / DSM 6381 / JCM 1539 / NBRC 10279 / NRRL Y-324) TaxID=294746 RepID=A5DGE1_PICGU|nr:uncharacterized protein PGUG_02342 [Meyerozyma guilliermondii ATCC 6260]EDK38244.2 hypothetical protein PGUG_02342 [Meyerozyma guilliermondii ATCC 6260]
MKKVVGENNVSTDEAELKAQSDSFFSTHHPPDPLKQKPKALVYPSSTEEVAELVKIAHEYRVPVIATSGFTSLEGQAMHTRGPNSIAISFANMHKILKIHPEDLDMTVEAGTSWQDIDQYLLSNDDTSHLMFGPDPGMGACIAGMVSTSASGTNAYKYGTHERKCRQLDGGFGRWNYYQNQATASQNQCRLRHHQALYWSRGHTRNHH